MAKKQQTTEQRELERQSAAVLGQHVSEAKGTLLLIFTALACLAPMALGLRLWNDIPLIVETGLIGPNGEDDSLPRWALVFLLPGLFFTLDVINHVQLRRFQRQEKVPPRYTRLMGRWGFPLVGLLLCAWAVPSGAGQGTLTLPLLLFWLVGLAVMYLGGRLLDRAEIPRYAGAAMMAAGVLLLYGAALRAGAGGF